MIKTETANTKLCSAQKGLPKHTRADFAKKHVLATITHNIFWGTGSVPLR